MILLASTVSRRRKWWYELAPSLAITEPYPLYVGHVFAAEFRRVSRYNFCCTEINILYVQCSSYAPVLKQILNHKK